MSLFLVGMRGAGKTSSGALAAARLGVPFADLDQLVERRAGVSIATLFATRGAQAFRELETAVALEVLPRPGQLVALGAGAVASPQVRAALRGHGRVVWLTASSEILRARIGGSARPSLTGLDPAEELATIGTMREPLYRQCADQRLDTSALEPEAVAHVIEQLWTSLPHHQLR
jgi:shikimate kinase